MDIVRAVVCILACTGAFMNTQHRHVLEQLVYKETAKLIINQVTILFQFFLHKDQVMKEVFQLQCIALLILSAPSRSCSGVEGAPRDRLHSLASFKISTDSFQ